MTIISLDKPRYSNLATFITWTNWLSALLAADPPKVPTGKDAYGYSISHLALNRYFTGNDEAAIAALRKLAEFVASEQALIDAGSSPVIDNDSNLHIGNHVRGGVQALAWCDPSPELKQAADLLFEQAMFNLHNPTLATWGGIKRTWSGWSLNNPWNNYNASFVSATIWYAVYTSNPYWMDKARAMLKAVDDAYGPSIGGGSPEGTGYGRSLGSVYANERYWQELTGERHEGIVRHATQTIHYFTHMLTPDFRYTLGVGDQARESTHLNAEEDRNNFQLAANISDDPRARALARWAMENIVVSQNLNAKYLSFSDAIPIQEAPVAPTALYWNAEHVGHYPRRSGWDKTADFMCITAGPNSESHDSHDQGSIWLWSQGQYILASQNLWTHSGIRQNALYQNTVVFELNGTFLNQVRNKTRVTPKWEGSRCTVDMGPSLPTVLAAAGVKWTRIYDFAGKQIAISDDLTFPSSVKAWRCLNTPVLPVESNGNTVLGPVTVTGWAPVIDWKAIAPIDDTHKGGYGMRIPMEQGRNIHTITCPIGFGHTFETTNEEDPVRILELETQLAAAQKTVDALKLEDVAQLQQIAALESDLQELGGVITAKNAAIVDLERQVAEGSNLLALPLSGGYDPAKVVALDGPREIVVVSR